MIANTVLGPVLALLAATAACVAPTEIGVTLPVPGGGSITGKFRGVDPNRILDLAAPEEEEEETCYQFTFLDEDGEAIGSETSALPGTVSVPEGTTDIQVEEADCEEESLADGDRGRNAGKTRFLGRAWRFLGFPAVPDIGAGTLLYSMTVRAPDVGSARATRDRVLASGFSGPLPPGVELYHYSQTRLEGTDVVFTAGDDDAFRSLVLALNANPAYATLDDATLAQVNGWHVASLVVPQSAFHYDPTPGATWSNSFEVRYVVAGTSRVHRVGGRFEYTQ